MRLTSLCAFLAVIVTYNAYGESSKNEQEPGLESLHCAGHGRMFEKMKKMGDALIEPGRVMCPMSDRMREIMKKEAEQKAQEEKAKAEEK